jgi:hypothetical protein
MFTKEDLFLSTSFRVFGISRGAEQQEVSFPLLNTRLTEKPN